VSALRDTMRGVARVDFETPLVGREREVSTLVDALDRAGRGQAGAVLVAGDAGVGKTRLLAELADRAATAGATVLLGHCLDVGGVGLPYLPFTEALRPLTPESGSGDGRPGDWHGLHFGALPTPGGDLSQLQLFDGVAGMLAKAGLESDGPALLVIEDLHWADQSTRHLFSFLIGRLREERLLVVGSYRTDDLHRRHPLRPLIARLTRLPVVERLDLGPFDAAEMSRYLTALRGAPVDDLTVRRILDRSEGNAYYAQELLHAGGDADVTGLLPAPLADVLLSRLEQLSPTAQQVVRMASVAGRRVGHELLARASGLESLELEAALREAITHQVLVAEEGERYAFRHALLAEAVYGDLLPGERVRLHATYARLIDETIDDREPLGSAAELAHHRIQSHDVPGALTASVRAAAEAESLRAPAEAWQHLERVLQLWDAVDDAEERASADVVRIGLRAAAMASRAGENSRAAALADSAAARLDSAADPQRAAGVAHKRALHLLGDDRPQQALEAALEALALAAEAGDKPTAASAWASATAAYALASMNREDEARQYAERALAEAIEIGSAGAEADALVTLAVMDRKGLDESGPELLVRARDLAQEAGDLPTEMRVSYNLAAEHYDSGDIEGALGLLDAAVERSVATGLSWSPWGVELQALQVVARFVTGDWDGSLAATRHADRRLPEGMVARLSAASLYVLVARGDPAASVTVRALEDQWYRDPLIAMVAGGCGADLLRWQDDPRGSLQLAERAMNYVEEIWPLFLGAIWLAALGLAAAGDLAEHARLVRDESALTEALDAGERLLAHARYVAREGSPRGGVLGPEGRAWLLRAEAEYSRVAGASDVELWRRTVEEFAYGNRYEQARSCWRLSEALLAADQREGAAAQARAAHSVAVELGARPLEQAVEALARRGRLDTGIAAPASADGGLTAREREVLALLADGLTNRQIGQRLYIAEKTASVHVSNILAKLGASGRTEAVTLAHRRGLLGA
jgi:DNA-binding CsgD family transcriptional regulator/tetratricopeptide (TPR) repeat protein